MSTGSRIINKALSQTPPAPINPRPADTTPPAAPGTPVVSSIVADSATITFTASVSSDVVGYAAFLDGNAMPYAYSDGNAASITLSGLTPGNHSVAVKAFDASNNFSGLTASIAVAIGYDGMGSRDRFENMADFLAAGGAAANPGPVWIGDKQFKQSTLPAKPILKNLMAAAHAHKLTGTRSEAFTSWSTPIQSGGATVTRTTVDGITNDTSTIDVPLGGRGFEVFSTGSTGLEDGNRYVFTVDVKNIIGSTTIGIRCFNAVDSDFIPIGAANNNQRIGIIFTHNAAGAGQYIRMGSGINGGAAASEVITATFTNPAIYEIGDDDLFYPYYPRKTPVKELPACTLDVNNNVVVATGAHIDYLTRKRNLVFLTGDSFVNDPTDFPQLANTESGFVIEAYGYSGASLSTDIEANFAANLAKAAYDIVVIQGGTNDLNSGTSQIAAMQADLITMCNACDAANLPVVIIDVAPRADISVDAGKLSRWKYWNNWVNQFCSDRGYPIVYASKLLADPTGLDRIDPLYVTGTYIGDYTYTGDTTHPTANGGMRILADALIDALRLVA